MTELTKMDIVQNREKLFNIKVGIFLYCNRRMAGLSQEQLEELVPLTRSAISLIEHGVRSASGNNISILMEFFKFSEPMGYAVIRDQNAMRKHLNQFQKICNESQENVDFLFSYWSDNPPIEEKNPILKYFPSKYTKKSKKI